MAECRLAITSRGEGWKSDIIVPARVEIAQDCVQAYYVLDGDECAFTYSRGRAEQTRKGSVNIRMSFVCGRRTACILGEGGLSGGYPVFTDRLDCLIRERGFMARIDYRSGNDGERVTVSLRALIGENTLRKDPDDSSGK